MYAFAIERADDAPMPAPRTEPRPELRVCFTQRRPLPAGDKSCLLFATASSAASSRILFSLCVFDICAAVDARFAISCCLAIACCGRCFSVDSALADDPDGTAAPAVADKIGFKPAALRSATSY